MVPAMQLPLPKDPILDHFMPKRKEVIHTSKGFIGGTTSNPWLQGRESHLERMVKSLPSDAHVQPALVRTV